MMTASTDNLVTAEKILDDVLRDAFMNNIGADNYIKLAGAYIALAAIKTTIETQEALRAQMEREY